MIEKGFKALVEKILQEKLIASFEIEAKGQQVKLLRIGTLLCDLNLNSVAMPDENKVNPPKDQGDHITIPIVQEQVKIDKKIVETGKVHISKVAYEDVDRYTIPYIEENVTVERIPKEEIVDVMPPAVRYEDDVMIISVFKEVAVVEKRIMLVEEIRVTKTKTEKTETREITLKKEEVQMNRSEKNR